MKNLGLKVEIGVEIDMEKYINTETDTKTEMVAADPVAGNHSNLYNEILLVVQGLYRLLHSEVNAMGAVVV